MKRFTVAAALVLIAALPAIAQEVPALTGTWTGNSMAMTPGGGGEGPVTFVVTEQDGSAFRADVTYPEGDKAETESVVGLVAPDGKTFLYAGDVGHATGSIHSASSLDLCYIEIGDDAVVACTRLTKQP